MASQFEVTIINAVTRRSRIYHISQETTILQLKELIASTPSSGFQHAEEISLCKTSKLFFDDTVVSTLIQNGEKLTLYSKKKYKTNPFTTQSEIPQSNRRIPTTKFSPNESDLNSLIELGYPRDLCQKALTCSYGNVFRAAEYLACQDELNLDEIQRAPGRKGLAKRRLAKKKNSASNTNSLFSLNDLQFMQKLHKEGFDRVLIPQVFEACDKNQEQTRALLVQMKD